MSKYNAILFTDIIRDSPTQKISIPALGAYKVANTLRQSGYSCLVVNHFSEFTIDEIYKLLDIAVSDETYLIGFSNTFFNLTNFGEDINKTGIYSKNLNFFPQGKEVDGQFFSYLKKLNDKIKIVMGGAVTRENMRCDYADFLVLGYAEANIVNLIEHIKFGVPLTHSYRNINNNKIIIKNPLATGYEFTNDKMVWLPEDVVTHTKLPIEIGRGCVFSCAFCAFPMNGKTKLDFIKQTNLLKEELLYNYNSYGIENYTIVDDTFNDSIEKLEKFREMILTLPFKPKFWCYSRLDLIASHPETIHILYEIGVREFYFGIETLDRKAGLAIGKGYNSEKQIAMLAQIKKTYPDINCHASFIIGAPYESYESVKRTMDAVISHEIKLDSACFIILVISKSGDNGPVFSSKINMDFKKYGYRELTESTYNTDLVAWENDEMNVHTADELNKYFQKNYKPMQFNGQGKANREERFPPDMFLKRYKKRFFDIIKQTVNFK